MKSSIKLKNNPKIVIFFLCWIAYAISYLGRTNLSIALEPMMKELHIGKAYGGAIGTSFFWTYAIGQILSGFIGSKFKEKQLIIVGFCGAAICNATIGMAKVPGIIFLAWSLNGLFLSLVWPPIVRILSHWFTKEEYNSISAYISMSNTVGILVSWVLSGYLVEYRRWEMVFFVPAVILLAYSIVLKICLKDKGAAGQEHTEETTRTTKEVSLIKILFSKQMIMIAVICFIQGAIKESINLWAPTIFYDLSESKNSFIISGFSTAIPIFSTIGIVAAGMVNKRFHCNVGKTLRCFTVLDLIISVMFMVAKDSLSGVVAIISLIMALLCGINSLVTVFIPMEYTKYNLASQVAGLLNFIVYAGAALGAWITGIIGGASTWYTVYIYWIVLAFIGAVSGYCLVKGNRRSVTNL